MNIIIAGGGDIGKSITDKLVSEGLNLTLIEKQANITKKLQNDVDAIVIPGNAEDVQILKSAKIRTAKLLIAVTRDDNVNLVISLMAKKLNPEITIITKITNSHAYFEEGLASKDDFGIDHMIDPLYLTIDKIEKVIANPNANEMVDYAGEKIQMVGVRVDSQFIYLGQSLAEIGKKSEVFKNLRIVAIYRNDKIIIPTGGDRIFEDDKIYFFGLEEHVDKCVKNYFSFIQSLKNIIIAGGNELGIGLAKKLIAAGKKVTIIDNDTEICRDIADSIKHIHVMHGSSNDDTVLGELNLHESCFIAVTKEDEFNIIASVKAKRAGSIKAITIIRNSTLVPIVASMSAIDSVFSPNRLAVGDILAYCRKGHIISVTPFSQINAESIKISIAEKSPFLEKPFQKIRFPEGMIVGVIIRNEQTIIPSGDTCFAADDVVIIFLLHSAIKKVQKFFNKKRLFGR
ncbi:MAG: Trk system potassium transporter TrkA [Spirochaetes bacterium]|nr:Trk system potassium transporter TrkA [Spirochaetota bacterium]